MGVDSFPIEIYIACEHHRLYVNLKNNYCKIWHTRGHGSGQNIQYKPIGN